LLYRLLALCAYLEQARDPKVADAKEEVQCWTRNFSQDYLEGLAKIEMIHDKTFQDVLERNEGTGLKNFQCLDRIDVVFWEVISMAFDEYKEFFSQADSGNNSPWLIASRDIHYKINELESLYPDMYKYTGKLSFALSYPQQEVGTHHVSRSSLSDSLYTYIDIHIFTHISVCSFLVCL
jgi:hypothetical protein